MYRTDGIEAKEMIGTDHHYLPFYSEKRPMVVDLIVDRNFGDLERYYRKKSVQQSSIIEGAWEASDYYENLGGKPRHLYFLAAPIIDENGEIIAAIETLQDVTRERQMEQDLKEYAGTLKNELNSNIILKQTIEGVLEGSPIAAFVIGRDHKIMFWNKACTELTGFSREEMIGTDLHYRPFYGGKRPLMADYIVDDNTAGLDSHYGKRTVQKSTVIEGAYEASDFYRDLGGRKRHLYFLAAPIYDASGKIIAAIETLQDVTRERQLELDLREYAESLKNELDVNINLRKGIEDLYTFLQSVIQSSPDRIYVLDGNGVITYVSKDIETGPESVLRKAKGIHYTELVDPENRDYVIQKWEAGIKGTFPPYELETKAKDGSKRNLLISVTPIKGTDKFIIVQRDITEYKNLETKFYESQRLAAIGQLSAGIAHEVRNPLSSIKMSLQILEKRLRPAGNDLKRFRIAEKEVEHLEKLVSDILIFAKPAEPDLKLADVNAFVEHSLVLAEKEIADRKIDVRIECDPSISPMRFDADKLNQALLNIYLNAIDAMPEQGRLTVTTRAIENGPAESVEIAIRDNGSGIDEKDLPYIFNPFFTKKITGPGWG